MPESAESEALAPSAALGLPRECARGTNGAKLWIALSISVESGSGQRKKLGRSVKCEALIPAAAKWWKAGKCYNVEM